MTLLELIDAQQEEIDALDLRLVGRLRPLFAQARDELRSRLAELVIRNRGDRWTAAHVRATLVELEAVLGQSDSELRRLLQQGSNSAARQAVEQLAAQADAAVASFGGATRLDLGTAARMIEDDGTLLDRHAKYTDKWTADSLDRIKKELVVETLKKSSVEDVVTKLTSVEGPYENRRFAARRLVLTETSHARNAQTQQQLAAKQGDGRVRKKRLVNILDNRTAPDTIAIMREPGNQVKDWDEEFEDPYWGRKFLHPPNRPNDRARMVMYFDSPEERTKVERDRVKADKIGTQQALEKAQ